MRSRRLLVYSLSAFALATPIVRAADAPSTEIRKTLSEIRAPELPREVARLVTEAKGPVGQSRCEEIVRAAIQVNPSSAAAIVGAAAKAWPEEAARFSAIAAGLQPKLAPAIAKAAASSAPAFANEIVVAVIKRVPAQYAKIAATVSAAVPGKDEQIVGAVVSTFPNLKPFIAKTTSESPNIADLIATTPPVEKAARELTMSTEQFLVVDLTPVQKATVSTRVLSGAGFQPTFGVPFTPGGGTPGEIKRSQTVEVPPGAGRDYSKP